MHTSTAPLALLTVTLHAWRLGNERRDLALLGACSGLLGVRTVVATTV